MKISLVFRSYSFKNFWLLIKQKMWVLTYFFCFSTTHIDIICVVAKFICILALKCWHVYKYAWCNRQIITYVIMFIPVAWGFRIVVRGDYLRDMSHPLPPALCVQGFLAKNFFFFFFKLICLLKKIYYKVYLIMWNACSTIYNPSMWVKCE